MTRPWAYDAPGKKHMEARPFPKAIARVPENRWNLSPQTEDRCANCCFPSWRFLCQVHGILHAKRSHHRINGTLVKSPGCHIQQVHPGYGFLKCLAGDTFRDRYFQLNEDPRKRQKYPSREWLRETRFSVFSTYVLLPCGCRSAAPGCCFTEIRLSERRFL